MESLGKRYLESVALHHRPVRAWQERAGEISWECVCGTVNKHQYLPTRFMCGNRAAEIKEKADRVFRNVSK